MGIDPVKAVFLDRDGVLNANVFYADTQAFESPRTVEDFALLPETIPSLQALQRAGFLLFLVSNQPNVAKGKSTMAELEAVHARLHEMMEAAGVPFTDFFYCYHHPDSTLPTFGGVCLCRKPSPYFLLQAARRHEIDMAQSWMIGDRLSDVVCGNRAGVSTLLVAQHEPQDGGQAAEEVALAVVPDLGAAVRLVLDRS